MSNWADIKKKVPRCHEQEHEHNCDLDKGHAGPHRCFWHHNPIYFWSTAPARDDVEGGLWDD